MWVDFTLRELLRYSEGYRVDPLVDGAVRFIDEHKEGPFYLFLSFPEAHHQSV